MSSMRTLPAGARRVDEVAVADIDADVREAPPQRVEEDEVAGLQLVALDGDEAGRCGLLVGAPRQHHAEARLEDVAREAAAVEARLRRRSATAVATRRPAPSPPP